jgi:hypothetical protein
MAHRLIRLVQRGVGAGQVVPLVQQLRILLHGSQQPFDPSTDSGWLAIKLAQFRKCHPPSSKQAGIERTVAEITSRVWSANTIDDILQTAAKEIGRALNVSEATIELNVEEQGASDHG